VPSTGQEVAGIATIGDEVFVVRRDTKHVDVYDAATLNVQRQLQFSANAFGNTTDWRLVTSTSAFMLLITVETLSTKSTLTAEHPPLTGLLVVL